MYMLDTDICIYIIKQKPLQVFKRFERIHPDNLCISSITFAELLNGAKKSHNVDANMEILKELSEILQVLAFDKEAAFFYGDIRSSLEKQGMAIGGNDLFIAAHALCTDCTLVTNNESEFTRVNGLSVENWVK